MNESIHRHYFNRENVYLIISHEHDHSVIMEVIDTYFHKNQYCVLEENIILLYHEEHSAFFLSILISQNTKYKISIFKSSSYETVSDTQQNKITEFMKLNCL